jgi:WD40 repeat protein
MTRVFISYSRKDKPFAARFTEALNKIDIETWIDWEDIPPTADWLDQIHKGIEQADGFLFLLSPDSVTSKVCGQEVNHAVLNAKRLIPIVVRDVDPNQVHPALAKVNWIYCREEDNFEEAIDKTLNAIRTDLTWVEFHRRLQVRALEWERQRDASLLLRGKDLQDIETQLATVGQKNPQPTDLQRQYTLSSRQRESRSRNIALIIGAVILAVLAFLSVFANNQRILAQKNEGTAIANANLISTEKANVQRQEATAIANADLALARQLAAQSQLLGNKSGLSMIQSGLLAIESLRKYPTIEGDQALKRNVLLFPKPVSSIQVEGEFTEEITHIVFSPDSKFLASASTDGLLRVWNVYTGLEVSTMQPDDMPEKVAFSPSGSVLASSSGPVVQLWDPVSGEERLRLLHEDIVQAFVFSPDGMYLGSCNSDGTIQIWNVATGEPLSKFQVDNLVSSIAFSSNGSYVVMGGSESLQVWDIQTKTELARIAHVGGVSEIFFDSEGRNVLAIGRELAQIWDWSSGREITRTEFGEFVRVVTFSSDWNKLATGSIDGSVVVQNARSGEELVRGNHDWTAGNDPVMGAVMAMDFSPDNRLILTGSLDGSARIWDTATGTEIIRLAADDYYGIDDVIDGFVMAVAFSPNGKLAAFGNSYGLIRVWEVDPDPEFMKIGRGIGSYYSDVAFSLDGTKLAYRDEDLIIHLWDITQNSEISRTTPLEESFRKIGFSSDGTLVFTINRSGTFRFWDIETGKELAIPGEDNLIDLYKNQNWTTSNPIWDLLGLGQDFRSFYLEDSTGELLICTDGKWFAVAREQSIQVWDVEVGEQVSSIQFTDYVAQLAINSDSEWIVSAGDDGVTQIWNLRSGQEVGFINHDSPVHTVAFSPDGRSIATGSGEYFPFGSLDVDGNLLNSHGTLVIWDTVQQVDIARIPFDNEVLSVVFSPDGDYIAGYGIGRIARIFDVSNGREVSNISHAEFGSVSSFSFSPDGKWIVTSGFGNSIKLWLWRPEDLISDLCSRLPRNLTRSEWNFYFNIEAYQATCGNLPIG